MNYIGILLFSLVSFPYEAYNRHDSFHYMARLFCFIVSFFNLLYRGSFRLLEPKLSDQKTDSYKKKKVTLKKIRIRWPDLIENNEICHRQKNLKIAY